MKGMLAERERLQSELKQRVDSVQQEHEQSKGLEVRLSQAMQQKTEALNLLQRVQEALPSETLREVFGQLVQTLEDGFVVESECERAEGELLLKEGELRQFMKKEVQGLLSTKVINLRKEVDK